MLWRMKSSERQAGVLKNHHDCREYANPHEA
jgi:hypothetical protein